jgi:hypothetical protein
MTCISGIGMWPLHGLAYSLLIRHSTACVCGASIICVDIVVRLIPRYRNFQIADSDTFLSASLSLSFGVMVCNLISASTIVY